MHGLGPFDPLSLVLLALFNPAVIAVGFLMGRAASEPQKIVIAGFAAACAGAGLIWVAAWVKLLSARGIGAEAGLFVLNFAVGMAWAAGGYYLAGRGKKS